jgi:hypothetical protein
MLWLHTTVLAWPCNKICLRRDEGHETVHYAGQWCHRMDVITNLRSAAE